MREIGAVNELLRIRRKELLEKDRKIKRFEVTTNSMKYAEYTEHCLVYLIP